MEEHGIQAKAAGVEESKVIECIKIFHNDFREALESIPLESVGRILLALMGYARNETPETIEQILEGDAGAKPLYYILREHIQRNENYRIQKSNAGKKGGGQKGNQNALKTNTNEQTEAETNANEQKRTPILSYPFPSYPNLSITRKKEIEEIVSYLNQVAGTQYKVTDEISNLIQALLSKGYTIEDFRKVIDKKSKEWKGTKFEACIRPSTLFSSKFDEYLNQPEAVETKSGKKNPFVDDCSKRTDIDYAELERKKIKN